MTKHKTTSTAAAAIVGLLLAARGAQASYEFRMKDLGCDYTICSVVSSSATSNTTQVVTRVHGTFRKVSTSTTTTDGQTYTTETIVRPDLASTAAHALHVVYTSTTGCSSSEEPIQTTGGATTYKNRVETTFNGHSCFKYYDVESNAIYADSDGYIWGSEQTNDDGEVSTITYTSYATSAVASSTFALSSSLAGSCPATVTETPGSDAYDSACNSGTGTGSVFVVAPPELGCDVKVLYETTPSGGDGTKTQTTVYAHGTFLLQTTIDTATWETVTTVLTRPDKGTEAGYARTYTLDHSTNNCAAANTLLVKTMAETYYFTNREEEYYNGFSCYKYYNDSALVYYVDTAQGYPRGLVEEGKQTIQYLYYDTTPLNETTFVLEDAELEACGSETGDAISAVDYEDACDDLVVFADDESSSSSSSSAAVAQRLSIAAAAAAFVAAAMLVFA